MTLEQEIERLIGWLRLPTEPDPSNKQWVNGFASGKAFAAAELADLLARARAALDAPPAAEEPAAHVSVPSGGGKILAGLRDAVAFVQGDESKGRSRTVHVTDAERGFVGAVYTDTGPWKPTDPTIEAGDPA